MRTVRRGLRWRVFLVVGAVLIVEGLLFVGAVRLTRDNILETHYQSTLDLLEEAGALTRCDADPAAFEIDLGARGALVVLYPQGRPARPTQVSVPDLSSALAATPPGGLTRVGSPWLAWPALVRRDRVGPYRTFFMVPPPPSAEGGAPLLRLLAVRGGLAVGLGLAIILLVTGPLVRRIIRLSQATQALADAGFDGAVSVDDDELGVIAAGVNAAAAKAREMLDAEQHQRQLLHDLFADLSHDVRTPLASMKLSTDALAHGEDPAAVARSLRAELEYLDGMFLNMATIARLRSAVLPIELRAADLRPIVARAEARFATLGAEGGVELHAAVPGEAVVARVDPLTLEQALSNAVHNAVKFAQAHVAVVLSAADGHAVIRILDDGPGLADAELARLTERRYRGADQGGRSGLGLGLGIAAQIMERHGGTLTLGNADEGAEVVLRLPLA